MPIPVICRCKAKIKAGDHLAGRSIRCPKCSVVLAVKAEEAEASFEVANDNPDENIRSGPASRRAASEDNIRPLASRKTDPNKAGLSKALSAKINSELTRQEKVVWIGQPIGKLLIMRSLPMGAGMVTMAIVFSMMGPTFFNDPNQLLFRILIWAFCFVLGIVGCLWPFLAGLMRNRTAYVLTNRRALVIKQPWIGSINVDDYQAMELVKLYVRKAWFAGADAGDVVFRSKTVVTTTNYVDRRGFSQGSSASSKTTYYGFLALDNAKEIERLIRETLVDKLLDRLNAD